MNQKLNCEIKTLNKLVVISILMLSTYTYFNISLLKFFFSL